MGPCYLSLRQLLFEALACQLWRRQCGLNLLQCHMQAFDFILQGLHSLRTHNTGGTSVISTRHRLHKQKTLVDQHRSSDLIGILQALQPRLDALLELLRVPAQFTQLLAHRLHLQHLGQKVHLLRHRLQVSVELPRLTQDSLREDQKG